MGDIKIHFSDLFFKKKKKKVRKRERKNKFQTKKQ